MASFKGGFKYIALLVVIGWMFFLGIIVGRGTSPVSFDTRKFQERLAAIAKNDQESNPGQKKVELEFYKTLDEPVSVGKLMKRSRSEDVIVKKIEPEKAVIQPKVPAEEKAVPKEDAGGIVSRDIPVKTSRKNMTFKKTDPEKVIPDTLKTEPVAEKAVAAEKEIPSGKGLYTIQVASYPDFKDAMVHITALEKKGFSAYKTMWKNDGKIWYRVRIGSFQDMDEAGKFLDKLNASNVKGMIIKRTEDENIQG